MKKLLLWIASFMSIIALTGCKDTSSESNKLQVYTSFYAMYDFARSIGGDCVDVYNMCSTGQEPHDYEPTAKDIAKLTEADVFIYSGMGMEHWVESILPNLGDNIIVINASDYAKTISQGNDPHIWLNPENAMQMRQAICDAFAKADKDNTDYYLDNFEICKNKTDALIEDYENADFKSKDIIVSHMAYGYLCDRFGLNQISVNGFTNSEDPTPSDIAQIQDFIKSNNISHIFVEPLGSSAVMDSIAKDTGASILNLDPFEGNIENDDYFTVMYENLNSLITALG